MVPIPYSLTVAGVGTGLPGGWLEDLCSYFVCHGHPSTGACRESRRLLPAASPSVTPATLSRGLEAPAVWGFCRLEQAWSWSSGRPESVNMLRGSYLAAGGRFTVRVGVSLSALGRWRCRTRGVGAARGRRAGTPATNDGSRRPRGALADCPDAVKIERESRRTVPWKIWGGKRQTIHSLTASIHPCRRAPVSCRVPRLTTVNPAAVITPASSSTGQYHAVVTA